MKQVFHTMDKSYLSSSSSSKFDPQNNEILHYTTPEFVPLPQLVRGDDDHVISTFEQNNDLDYLLGELPTITEDFLLESEPRKRSLASSLKSVVHDQENNVMDSNERKKKQKIIHREIERQRRLEMSSLHTSLKSLLPLEYTKGKRSISDHIEEAVKYIKQMQQKIQVLNDKRNALIREASTSNGHNIHDVIVNVFKGCLETIVITSDGDQGLPLSKVLQCLIQEGLDVVNSISKKVNNIVVHSIHAQVGDENSITINATTLKEKFAKI